MWEAIANNRTKVLGWLSMFCAGLLAMIAMGMFGPTATEPALLEPQTLRWFTIALTIIQLALGGGTVAVGRSNSTQERVESARAEVATAMTTALNAPPPAPARPQV